MSKLFPQPEYEPLIKRYDTGSAVAYWLRDGYAVLAVQRLPQGATPWLSNTAQLITNWYGMRLV